MNQYRDFDNYLKEYPSIDGYFGKYGGNYLDDPELIKAFNEYAEAYNTIAQSAQFISELRRIRRDFQGRPTPVYHCQNLSNLLGRTQIYLKREDLNHTGAHKLNHCMGEGLLAKFMGKKKLIAETGAGQHGVALATAAAYFGMECDIYMGEVDIAKQAPNVTRMKLLGANVIPVSFGLKTLKEAVDAAFMAYAKEYKDAVYCIGTAAGPHPFPLMVRDFQFCIGEEAREQFKAMTLEIAPLDREGNKVINVLVYPETVSFRAAAGYTKEVRLVVPVKDESEDSYERTYTTPETVVIKGKRSTIDSFSGITANEIDIAYYYEDSEIPIEFDFPEGVSIADGQDQLLLKLKVVEKKQKEKDKDKENDSENESDNENG